IGLELCGLGVKLSSCIMVFDGIFRSSSSNQFPQPRSLFFGVVRHRSRIRPRPLSISHGGRLLLFLVAAFRLGDAISRDILERQECMRIARVLMKKLVEGCSISYPL